VAIRAALAIFYFGSAFSKLHYVGLTWADGYNLQTSLLAKHDQFSSLPLGHWLAQHHGLCVAASWLTLAFELGFGTVLLWPRTHWTRWLYFGGGILFHVSTWLFMNIYQFLLSVCAVYLVFIEWPTARQELRRLFRRPAPAQVTVPPSANVGQLGRWCARAAGVACLGILGLELAGPLFSITSWPVTDDQIFIDYRDYRSLAEVLSCEVTLPGEGTRPCFGAISQLGRPVALRAADGPSADEAARAWAAARLRGMPAQASRQPGRSLRITLRHFPVENGVIEVRRRVVEVPF
jgi:hypothetical protein